MAFILKNTTNNDIFVDAGGDLIPSQSSIRINPKGYASYTAAVDEGADSEDVPFLTNLENGDLVVNDGNVDLTFQEAKLFLKTFIKVIVKFDGVNVDNTVQAINIRGQNVSVTQDSQGEVTLDIGDQDSVIGNLYHFTFSEGGSASNEYLESEGRRISNQVPQVVPFRSKVVAYTFSNRDNDADTRVRIVSVSENNGNSPVILKDEWTLNNTRTARKSNFSSDIIFEAGDKVVVYLQDIGTDADDVLFRIYLKVIDNNNQEVVEEWSGDIDAFNND